MQGQYLGLSLLTPTSWRWFVELAASRGDGYRVDMTSLFSALVRAGHKLVGVPIQGPWGEIDSPSDLTLFEELYFSARASL